MAEPVHELVVYDHVIAFETDLQASERLFILGFADEGQQLRHGDEEHGVPLHAGPDAEACGDMGLAGAGVAVHDDTAPLLDELQCFQLGEHVPAVGVQCSSYPVQPQLRSLYGVEVLKCCEGERAHVAGLGLPVHSCTAGNFLQAQSIHSMVM